MMNRYVVWAALLMIALGFSVGCVYDNTSESSESDPEPVVEAAPGTEQGSEGTSDDVRAPFTDLPVNPPVPGNPSGTRMQLWYFAYKSYDNTFRIRWPTYFYTEYGVGPGSYTLVDGQRAEFRNHWTDDGVSTRPSYTIRGPQSRFSGEVLCILYDRRGNALAWFTTRAPGTTQGRLP